MKIRKKVKLDNRGASLIFVIIAVVFVAAIGTIALRAALLNIEMKKVDRKAKQDFYSAEMALDELKTVMEEMVSDSMALAFQAVMTNYSTKNEAMQKKLLRDEFVRGMKSALAIPEGSTLIPLSSLNNCLKKTRKVTPTSDGAELIGAPVLDWTSSDDYLVIQGLKITYLLNGYMSTISCDIKIMLPENSSSYGANTTYQEYALIADESLNARFTDYNISGNIYAGSGGINTGYGNEMIITGSRIISKGDILIKDMGELIISGTATEVWANSLITTQTDKIADMSGETKLTITGDCFIRNDLVLDAKKSNVSLTGNYYGYSSGDGSDVNSSVVINAANSKLDLSGLGRLYLAGRAYISLMDGGGAITYYEDESYGAGSGANANILTGESIAIKGSQNAYLLPSEFIQVGHNPISWSEYILYYDTTSGVDNMVNIPTDAIVFNDASISEEARKLSYYLNPSNPIKKAFYKFSTNENVVYYYLNFKTQELATTYFINYLKCFPERVYNGFPINSVKINETPGACITAGNIMTYNGSVSLIQGTNGSFNNNYATSFKNLTSSLHKNLEGTVSGGANIVFENIIDIDSIRADSAEDGSVLEKDITIGEENYYLCVINNEGSGTYNFDLSGKKGIIIATGNISVNRNFTGLIISNKTIELNTSTITADPDTVSLILSSDSDIAKYFRAYKNSSSGAVNVSELLQIENWRKN